MAWAESVNSTNGGIVSHQMIYLLDKCFLLHCIVKEFSVSLALGAISG